MKNQLLAAAAIVKSLASAYPDYSFSSCYCSVLNHADGTTSFCYEAYVHCGVEAITARAETLSELYPALKNKLQTHFTLIAA